MSQSKPQGRFYWVEHIEAWMACGVSRTEYCRTHGLSRKTFGWWIWRLNQERREPSAPEAPRLLQTSPRPATHRPGVCMFSGVDETYIKVKASK
jgi:transposase